MGKDKRNCDANVQVFGSLNAQKNIKNKSFVKFFLKTDTLRVNTRTIFIQNPILASVSLFDFFFELTTNSVSHWMRKKNSSINDVRSCS